MPSLNLIMCASITGVDGTGRVLCDKYIIAAHHRAVGNGEGVLSAAHLDLCRGIHAGQQVAGVIDADGHRVGRQVQSAADSLLNAQLSMSDTEKQMENYTITSPISGTIIEKNAKAGDALTAGSDLCTIYDLSYLEMTINVDELQVSSLKVGQTVQVTADAVKDKTYEGTVTRVAAVVIVAVAAHRAGIVSDGIALGQAAGHLRIVVIADTGLDLDVHIALRCAHGSICVHSAGRILPHQHIIAAHDAEEPAEGIDPAEAGAVVVD